MTRIPVADRRRALVDAAIRVVTRDGVGGVTTRAVVAEAGMSLASLHYAFASREDLLEAVIADVTAQEHRAATEGLLPLDSPAGPAPAIVDVIRAGLDRFLDLLIEDPRRERALLELSLHALHAPGHEATLGAQYATYRAAAEASLATAAQVSGYRWRVPLPTAARLLVTLTDGLTLGWLADRDTAAARATVVFAAKALAALAGPADPTDPPSPFDSPAPSDTNSAPTPNPNRQDAAPC
ncbi:TetR/AcrR family transcriptional regulator [Pengzhenrongella sicca]|uniref:TetR family transcriptional regulator n=1 Tax=Pengzhenrongella sicca TaxID=2819238 RepID=A0A8A4ZHZ6_9MICO|nr:TetR/AcrR family transcriptional regulator [Pengzhenrongella sicca]QTE30147.1 TetR family transcriptional regulator [Pengzhenrongella sicca]